MPYMREIITYPNPILVKRIKEVEKVDKILLDEIEILRNQLAEGKTAAGLAANQIGYKRRFVGIKNTKGEVIIMINPEIMTVFTDKVFPKIETKKGETEDFLEGCLSFPNLFGTVKRFLKIEAQWMVIEDSELVVKKEILEGFDAIVFQHELDHVDGEVFIERIRESNGKLYRIIGNNKTEISVGDIIK